MFGRNPKIRVEIIGGAFPRKQFCEVDGNKIILDPGHKGRGGSAITAEYDNTCLVPYYSGPWPFRSVKHKLILKEGSARCVSFGKDAGSDAPSLTRKEVKKFGDANAIKLAGHSKEYKPTYVYILIFANIIISLIALALQSMRVRF